MPFRDQDWEDYQRDCSLFPAYTDYVFGIDTRPEVENEPGLHPQIFSPPLPPTPPQRLQELPQSMQYQSVYSPIGGAAPPRHLRQHTRGPSLLKHESSVESSVASMISTPCPAPRTLSTPNALPVSRPRRLLRPGELIADPLLASLTSIQQRVKSNAQVVRAWEIIRSEAEPKIKLEWAAFLRKLSQSVAAMRGGYRVHEAARVKNEEQAEREREQYKQETLATSVWNAVPGDSSRRGLGTGGGAVGPSQPWEARPGYISSPRTRSHYRL